MTPKEKAIDLVDKYLPWTRDWDIENYALLNAKQCALIAVDEILDALFVIPGSMRYMGGPTYWIEVKKEIELL